MLEEDKVRVFIAMFNQLKVMIKVLVKELEFVKDQGCYIEAIMLEVNISITSHYFSLKNPVSHV